MGLFRPLNESVDRHLETEKGNRDMAEKMHRVHSHNFNKMTQALSQNNENKANQYRRRSNFSAIKSTGFNHKANMIKQGVKESTITFLGISDEELYGLSEGNCNSDTCKCKGGTCPVEVTDGISTSAAASKKLFKMGKNNETDLNAVTPNAEYNQQNDARFIGDGDSPETSKTNIPAILAAKTAGGSPHEETVKNGVNSISSSIFKLKKFTKDDPDGY